jgi:hypothetical protein
MRGFLLSKGKVFKKNFEFSVIIFTSGTYAVNFAAKPA